MAYLELLRNAIFISLTGSSFHMGVGVPLGFGVFLGFHTTAPKGSEAAAHLAHFIKRRRPWPS